MTDPTQPMGPTPNDPANGKQPDTLRDARLAHALRHMPDAHMQPSAQTRSAVLQEAMRAVGAVNTGFSAQQAQSPTPTGPHRWWHAWLGQPGQRVPWGAAVASLAVFGFITVMWYGQEVPDAAPQRSPVAQHPAQADAQKGASAEAQTDAPIEAVPKAPAAATVTATATVTTNKVAKAPSPPAPSVAAPAPAPPVAPAVAEAPQADVHLERRSKAMQAEVAAAPAKALADAGPVWVLTIDGVQHRVGAEQAQNLVAQLRGLAYGPVTATAQSQAANQTQGDGAGGARVQQADAAIRLESAGQEHWRITPGEVTHYLPDSGARSDASTPSRGALSAQTGAPLRSSITPAQYAALRSLAMALGTQPP